MPEPNERDALRARLDGVLPEERQHEIDEAYAAGYAKHPQVAWVGKLGLDGLAAFDQAEGGPPL